MAEMLSDNMEVEHRWVLAESEGSPGPRSMRRREVPDMLSWLHCFSLYAAIVSSHRPDRARQMWAYQALMITEARRCGGVAGYLMPPSVSKQHQESMLIFLDLTRLSITQHSLCMGIGDSPILTVCFQITQGKSVPSTIQGQPKLSEDQQECTQLIKRNTQGTLRKD